jgi:hypothetical protein
MARRSGPTAQFYTDLLASAASSLSQSVLDAMGPRRHFEHRLLPVAPKECGRDAAEQSEWPQAADRTAATSDQKAAIPTRSGSAGGAGLDWSHCQS